MTTRAKHAQRSRRNHMIYFQSEDKATHELDEWKNPIYKDHPKATQTKDLLRDIGVTKIMLDIIKN